MDKQIEQSIATLESGLQRQIGLHDDLVTLMSGKREALRAGQATRLDQTVRLENQKVQAIAELEKRRLELVAALTLVVQLDAQEPVRLVELAERLPGPAADRVRAMRAQLRQRIESVRRETTIARRATESLMRHVQGLMQTIAGGQTYAQGGRMLQPSAGVSTFSLTA